MAETALSQLEHQIDAIRREAFAEGYAAAMKAVQQLASRSAPRQPESSAAAANGNERGQQDTATGAKHGSSASPDRYLCPSLTRAPPHFPSCRIWRARLATTPETARCERTNGAGDPESGGATGGAASRNP